MGRKSSSKGSKRKRSSSKSKSSSKKQKTSLEGGVSDGQLIESKEAASSSAAAAPTVFFSSPIAQPLADSGLSEKALRLVRKGAKAKKLRRGVKEVTKALRKGEKGVCIIAGDISPIDVISHIPLLCEESAMPYVFVPSKSALGVAAATKRPTSCVVVLNTPDMDYAKLYEKTKKAFDKYYEGWTFMKQEPVMQ